MAHIIMLHRCSNHGKVILQLLVRNGIKISQIQQLSKNHLKVMISHQYSYESI